MSRTLRRLIPSPAMIVALVALVMSLGSSAYALVVTGGNIVDNSVTGKDIGHGSVKGKDIHKHSLRGHDLGADSVGDLAIKESRLKTVPSARSAAGLDRWVVVRADGTPLRGRGGPVAGNPPGAVRTAAYIKPTSVEQKCCPGNYDVTFAPGTDVSKCSIQATIVSPTKNQHALGGQIIVAPTDKNNAVQVRTGTGLMFTKAEQSSRPFQLAAIC
jgi:hypothetical protein